MTSAEIRQSFLDFFKSKGHSIVPSASLMPDSPNLLFTNAGMNQFVPIFLGQRAPDVSKWAGAIPGSDTRAADTQKVIRAGGKHNDLEDVGLDTYHHTFFEMLGNWSFGDYFKKEAITWAWELITEVYKFPKSRLYATVYSPDKTQGDPSELDQEAYDIWAQVFRAAGLDPQVHIVYGNKKDNFWMMGETGPCGPCSEIHVDLTPQGDTKGGLVNQGSAECIEIWNLVFIQFNANPDGTFSPLPAKHVDTGMGFERLTSFIQCTRNFTDFSRVISNYETDIFRPIFDKIERLSGKRYGSKLPTGKRVVDDKEVLAAANDDEGRDIAFRVIADHIRTVSFAIADGVEPGNGKREYVVRRILRRAARYGRALGFHEPFFYKLVSLLADTMGHVFPEIRAKQEHIEDVVRREEEAFERTLDEGCAIFEVAGREIDRVKAFFKSAPTNLTYIASELDSMPDAFPASIDRLNHAWRKFFQEIWQGPISTEFLESAQNDIQQSVALYAAVRQTFEWSKEINAICEPAHELFKALQSAGTSPEALDGCRAGLKRQLSEIESKFANLTPRLNIFPGELAFKLYDTYGFPLDLTELMARERGLTVDVPRFKELMGEQKTRARAAQKKTVITLQDDVDLVSFTEFVGYEKTEIASRVLKTIQQGKRWAVVLPESPFYAEMGGQVGDTGTIAAGAQLWPVVDTKKVHLTWLHIIDGDEPPAIGTHVNAQVDVARRHAIERHHTVTHLLHWALHQVVNPDATQKGSYVGPDKLTFDFSSAPLTPQQVADVERLVNERILENAVVSWTEIPYSEAKSRKEIMQFFGEKYGDQVRVVQIGGRAGELNGYSVELCGGTHTRATGEIGLFRIAAESAIAAGIRRIEAVSGLEAYKKSNQELQLIKTLSGKVNSPASELEKKIESLLAHQKELEKQLKSVQQKQAVELGRGLVAKAQTLGATRAIIENLGTVDGDFLQATADALKGEFKGVVVLGAAVKGAVALVATVSAELTKQIQAGKIIQTIAPVVGGKGGGRPDNARGGGKEVSKLNDALVKAGEVIKQLGGLVTGE